MKKAAIRLCWGINLSGASEVSTFLFGKWEPDFNFSAERVSAGAPAGVLLSVEHYPGYARARRESNAYRVGIAPILFLLLLSSARYMGVRTWDLQEAQDVHPLFKRLPRQGEKRTQNARRRTNRYSLYRHREIYMRLLFRGHRRCSRVFFSHRPSDQRVREILFTSCRHNYHLARRDVLLLHSGDL